MQYEVY